VTTRQDYQKKGLPEKFAQFWVGCLETCLEDMATQASKSTSTVFTTFPKKKEITTQAVNTTPHIK
jgi:hypothetical protein